MADEGESVRFRTAIDCCGGDGDLTDDLSLEVSSSVGKWPCLIYALVTA